MSLTTSNITGRVPLPTNEPTIRAVVTFTLVGYDTQGRNAIPSGADAVFTLNRDAEIPAGAKLWQNTAGLRGTVYRMTATWFEPSNMRAQKSYSFGYVQVGDAAEYTIADLLNSAPPDAVPGSWWHVLTQDQYDEVMTAVDQAIQASDELQAAVDAASDRIVQDLGYDNTRIGAAITSESGMPTALTTNRYGELSKFAIDNTLSRIPSGILGPRHLTNMDTIATWGASDIEFYKAQYSAMAAQLGAEHFSGGNSGAFTDSIWQEQGLFDFDVIFPNGIIPETSAPVPVNIWNLEVRNATRPRPVILDGLGVEGIIDGTTDGNIFTRTGLVPGVSADVPANGSAKAISLNGIKYADCCQIWCVGRNDISVYGGSESQNKPFIDMTIAAYLNHPTVDKRVLVYGYYTFGNASATQIRGINYANAYYKKYFADKFVDVLGYYMSADVWAHTGITPTQADLAAQAATRMPPSLAMDNTHYSQSANQALITNVVKPRLISLGWFKEV